MAGVVPAAEPAPVRKYHFFPARGRDHRAVLRVLLRLIPYFAGAGLTPDSALARHYRDPSARAQSARTAGRRAS